MNQLQKGQVITVKPKHITELIKAEIIDFKTLKNGKELITIFTENGNKFPITINEIVELEQLKKDLNNILDDNIIHYEAIQKAEELEQLNTDNKIKLNADLIEIIELLTLIKADKEITIKRAIKEAIKQKKEAFKKFIERQIYFTDYDKIDKVDAIFYDKGIYLKFASTRNNLNVFIDNDFKVIRKPKKVTELKTLFINNLNINIDY